MSIFNGDAREAGNDADSGEVTIFPTHKHISTPTNVGGAPQADAPSKRKSTGSRRHKPETPKTPEDLPSKPVDHPPAEWPTQEPEEDEEAYLTRAIRICEQKHQLAAVAWVAHLKLDIPAGSETISRIGAIRNRLKRDYGEKYGARLYYIFQAILEAQRTHEREKRQPFADVLNLVEKIAVRLVEDALRGNSSNNSAAGGRKRYGRPTHQESARRAQSATAAPRKGASALNWLDSDD